MSTVLVLSPMIKMSGNLSTADRIRRHYEKAGYQCLLYDPKEFSDSKLFHHFLTERWVIFIIGIHAYHSGVPLIGCPVPYVILLGGTDVNVYSEDPVKYSLMKTALFGARKVVSFGTSLAQAASNKWAEIRQDSFSIIPQAVYTCPSTFSLQQYLHSCLKSKADVDLEEPAIKVFLIAGGIRSVKDPLYLVKVFSEWHEQFEPKAFLVFMGPMMDKDYGDRFTQVIDRLPGVLYVGGVSMEDSHAAIRDSYALVNSSLSEGMSTAILEAMGQGTPVIARRIPGNTDLVEDQVTGLLYDTPQEFIENVSHLMSSSSLRSDLTNNAQGQVLGQHSIKVEQDSYLSLMASCL